MSLLEFDFKESFKPTWKIGVVGAQGAIEYPRGPHPWVPGRMMPGEGIYAAPFECESILDVFGPPGKMDGVWAGLLSMLGKLGYVVKKLNEVYEVSPTYTEYYQKIIAQKRAWEAEIKSAFASLSKAIEDFELLTHDLRKYAEYLNYYENLQRAKREKKVEEVRKANHIFRAIFVDQVDVHTGELSMRNIALRWPTIIADFMELTDVDIDFKEIAKKLKVSKAEAVILATKNKLFLEWRDRMFIPMIKQRYRLLRRLAEARKHSINEYREQLRLMMARYEYIREMAPLALEKAWWWRPGITALVVNSFTVWAWKPFGVEEKHKATREAIEYVSAREAGFTLDEIRELKKIKEGWDGTVPALPAEPAYDKWVRVIKERLEKAYGVRLTVLDVYNVIEELARHYVHPERHKLTRGSGLKVGEAWPYSPYFILLEISVAQQLLRTPDGATLEDFWIEPLMSSLATQNIIIGKMLELVARNKYLDNKISLMLGEYGVSKEGIKKIDEILQQEFPETFGKGKEKEPSSFVGLKESINRIKSSVARILDKLGIRLIFMYSGPYEPILYDRITERYFPFPAREYWRVVKYIRKAVGVPGG